MKLTNRLNAVVSLVSQRKVADIGCDHGKTAIKLILDKISDSVIASDVNMGPAEACSKNVAKYGLTEQIEVRCGNGISVLKPEEADCIIIAGMGGELISKIIDDNIEVAKLAKEIIMQPMTSEESLREYLTENGFCITDEVLAKEGEKIMYEQITGEKAKEIMDTSEDYIILDVREQDEFNEGHIKGAILLPYTEINEKAESILPDKDKLILVYCRSGRRSKIAAESLAALGYTNIKEFGGIIDWKYEIEK